MTGKENNNSDHHPGQNALFPWNIPFAGWKQIGKRVVNETVEDDILTVSAAVAFYFFFSVIPLIISAISIYGLFFNPSDIQSQIQNYFFLLPADAKSLLQEILQNLAGKNQSTLSTATFVALGGALFTASLAINSLIAAIGVTYDEKETRNFIYLRLLSILYTLISIVFGIVILSLISLTPTVLSFFSNYEFFNLLFSYSRWFFAALLMMLWLGFIYRFSADRRHPKTRWVSIGAIVATSLWLLVCMGFSYYVENFGNYDATYGSLGTVVVILFWLYLSAFCILFGSEVNAEIELQTAKDSTVGHDRPMGDRNAVKADTRP